MNNPTQHECSSCGHTWLTGQHGGHDCKDRLLAKIAKLEAAAVSLAGNHHKAMLYDALMEEAAQIDARNPSVAWQFFFLGEWHNGIQNLADHRKNTEAAGIPTRDLYAKPVIGSQHSGLVDVQRLLDWNRAQPEPRPIAIGREYQVAEACARLNSSPVSSGDPEKCSYQDDPRSPAELSLAGCNCVRFGEGNPHWPCKLHTPVSACGVDERAAFEAWYLGHFYMGDKQCGLEWLSTEPCGGYRHQHPAEQWIVWQARAALSAPSRGEQVRDRYTCIGKGGEYQLLGLAQGAGTLKGLNHMVYRNVDGVMFVREPEDFLLRMEKIAAPSAGSQQGGE